MREGSIESALDSRSVDRYRNPDLRARNRARDRGWHRIPWTGCLLVPKAARSQDRSQSQVVPSATRFLGVLATVTRVRPRGQRVDDGADDAEHVESCSCSSVYDPRRCQPNRRRAVCEMPDIKHEASYARLHVVGRTARTIAISSGSGAARRRSRGRGHRGGETLTSGSHGGRWRTRTSDRSLVRRVLYL